MPFWPGIQRYGARTPFAHFFLAFEGGAMILCEVVAGMIIINNLRRNSIDAAVPLKLGLGRHVEAVVRREANGGASAMGGPSTGLAFGAIASLTTLFVLIWFLIPALA